MVEAVLFVSKCLSHGWGMCSSGTALAYPAQVLSSNPSIALKKNASLLSLRFLTLNMC
jgi:hypothetical protein